MMTHEKDRPHLAALSGLAATALFLLLLFGPCFSAHAESYDFYATTNVTAGDVVIWDTSDANAKAIKAADDQFSMDIVGIAAETVSAGNDVRVRFSAGKVACNISGTIDITSNPWLVVSSTTGKAEGLSSRRAGTFAKAITNTGDPQAGQCYVALNVGLSAYGVEGDHGVLSGLGDDDHSQYHNNARGDARYYTETELDAGQLDDRYFREDEHLDSSAGAGDAGKPIKLDAGGHVDATMINDPDVDHGSIGGLADDDHSQYHNDGRGDARYLYRENVGAFTPDGDYEPATKKYVDDNAGGVTKGSSFPGAPDAGNLFYHTTHDTLFQYENSKWNPIINYGSTLALYVDDGAGTDATGKGYGAGANATATIQYAWDNLVPAIFNGVITINVAGATYVEELILSGKTPGSSTAEIILLGELTSLHSGTADADSTTSVLEDDANPWGGGPEVGNLLIITGGTGDGDNDKFIRLDDADSLTPAGLFATAPDATTTYTIYALATIIQPGAGNTALTLTGQASVTVKYIEFSAGQHGILAEEGSRNINVTSCEFDTQTSDGLKLETGAALTVNTAYMHANSGSGVRVTAANATVSDAYILGCNTSNNAVSGGVKVLRSGVVLFFRCYIDGNNRHGVLNQYNSTIQFAGGANASTITNHDTTGDVGVKSDYTAIGISVVGQTYPVGTNDDDEDADAATFSTHT